MKLSVARVAGLGALCAIAASAMVVEPALAGIGDNIGKEATSWATGLLLAVGALVAIPALAKRDLGGGLVIALLVLVIGGFVFAQGPVKSAISQVWQTIGGG